MGWRLHESTLDVLVEYERLEASVRRGEVRGGLWSLADIAVAYATYRKLGFDSTESSISGLLAESIDPLVEFHVGDWWTQENVSKFCERNGFNELETKGEIALCDQFDPRKRKYLVFDRRTLGVAMLACLLTDNDKALQLICASYHAAMPVDYYGGNIDELFQRLLLFVAALVAGSDMLPFEREINRITERPLKMSLALRDLIGSVFANDQAAFEESLPSSLSIRMRRWEYRNVVDHISLNGAHEPNRNQPRSIFANWIACRW